MYFLVQLLVPLGICVALPVLIVWLIFRASMNSDNKRAQVLIEAIKANNNVDATAIANAFSKKRKTPLEILNSRLLKGCIFGLCGLVIVIASICFFFSEGYFPGFFAFFLIPGLILLAIGSSYLIVYFVTRKQLPSTDKTDNPESSDE